VSSAPSRSSVDPVGAALALGAEAVLRAVAAAAAAHPVVLIDGCSGAGKTSLARLLAAQWPGGPVQLVALDSLYPGWDGLDAGVEIVRAAVLVPRARGEAGAWRRWDWDAGAPAEEHVVDPVLPLIVEGSGVLTAATAPLGDVRVWVDAPAAARRRRALDRDGDLYRPHWERWAAQERRHVARDDPRSLATVEVVVP
jgi:hypothetical protein